MSHHRPPALVGILLLLCSAGCASMMAEPLDLTSDPSVPTTGVEQGIFVDAPQRNPVAVKRSIIDETYIPTLEPHQGIFTGGEQRRLLRKDYHKHDPDYDGGILDWLGRELNAWLMPGRVLDKINRAEAEKLEQALRIPVDPNDPEAVATQRDLHDYAKWVAPAYQQVGESVFPLSDAMAPSAQDIRALGEKLRQEAFIPDEAIAAIREKIKTDPNAAFADWQNAVAEKQAARQAYAAFIDQFSDDVGLRPFVSRNRHVLNEILRNMDPRTRALAASELGNDKAADATLAKNIRGQDLTQRGQDLTQKRHEDTHSLAQEAHRLAEDKFEFEKWKYLGDDARERLKLDWWKAKNERDTLSSTQLEILDRQNSP